MEGKMKTLSVWQPAAGLLVSGRKTIENRSRPLLQPNKWEYPFWTLIHSSKQRIKGPVTSNPKHQALIDKEDLADYPTGVILGAVCFSGVHPVAEVQSEWASGPFCHTVQDYFALPNPVPYKGQLGLYNIDPVDLGYENLEAIASHFPSAESPFDFFVPQRR